MPSLPVLALLGAATAGVGALGGIGGAVLLVPILVLLGADPAEAAPIGLLSVAAGALAAAPRHLREGVVHHRIGLLVETAASIGAIAGAMLSGAVSDSLLARVIAAVALVAALAGSRRRGMRNPTRAAFAADWPGEWPGTLGGAYRMSDGVVPYAATRVRAGWLAMLGAGVVSGMGGVGGGFIKTPILSEIMHVPVRVAAATSTFTVGITATAGLAVMAVDGRLDLRSGAAVVAGGLVGGELGSRAQSSLDPVALRRVLAVVLAVVGLVVLVRG